MPRLRAVGNSLEVKRYRRPMIASVELTTRGHARRELRDRGEVTEVTDVVSCIDPVASCSPAAS